MRNKNIFSVFLAAAALTLIQVSPLFSAEYTLEESVRLALDNASELKQQHEIMLKSKSEIKRARSPFFPKLDFSFGAAYNSYATQYSTIFQKLYLYDESTFSRVTPPEFVYFPVTTLSRGSGVENYTARLTLTQPIFTWGKLTGAYRISRLQGEIEDNNFSKQEFEVKFQVNQLFYSVLLTDRLITVMDESIKQLEAHVKNTEILYEAGVVKKYDLLRARVQLASIRPNLIKLKNSREITLKNFGRITGVSPESGIVLKGGLEYSTDSLDRTILLEKMLSAKPELKVLEGQKKVAEQLLKIQQAGNKPTLSLAGNYQYQGGGGGTFSGRSNNEWKDDWNAVLSLSLPLFNGFETQASVRKAKADIGAITENIANLKKLLAIELESALLQLTESEEMIKAQDDNVLQAKEGLELAKIQYAEGVLSSLEVLDAEVSLSKAKSDYYNAVYNFIMAKTKIKKLTGEL